MNWKMVKLAEVAAIERNGIDPSDIKDGTNYLGLEHIESGGRILGRQSVSNGELASNKFTFGPDHVLYGKLRPYLAKIALPDFEGVCSTDILPIRPGPKLNRKFLAYFLRQPSMVDFATSRSTGANLPRLSPKALDEFEIPLPPLDEQRRIAEILDHTDNLRRLQQRSIKRLTELGQSIFHEMFDQPNIKRLPLISVVANVQIGPFGSLLHRADYVEGGVPLINPMHIRDGALEPDPSFSITAEKSEQLKRYRLIPGQIIMGRRGEMGRCAVVREEHRGLICGTGSMVLEPDTSKVSAEFVCYYLRTPGARGHLENAASGVTMANLNTKSLDDVPTPFPSMELQEQFTARLRYIEQLKSQASQGLLAMGSLLSSVQQRAFRGEF